MAYPGSGFQFTPGSNCSSIPCGQCVHYYGLATSLQNNVTLLKSEVLTLQAEKAQSEAVISYLLRLNASYTEAPNGRSDSNQCIWHLSEKIIKAETKNESMQSMLERTLKIICQLSMSSVDKKVFNFDGPLIDLDDSGLMDGPVPANLLSTPLSPVSNLEQSDEEEPDDSTIGTPRQSEVVLKESGSDHFPEAPHYGPASSVVGAEHCDRIMSAVSKIRVH